MIVNGYKIEPGAYLIDANLEDANLESVSLNSADLRRAYLVNANLHRAQLGRANLEGANFHKADLLEADLREADLEGATFVGANLRGALFSKDKPFNPEGKTQVSTLLEEISFRMDVEVIETPENRDKIISRLEQLSSDVARLAGISKQETPAKTALAAIEASNLTSEIMELVSDAVLDCADME